MCTSPIYILYQYQVTATDPQNGSLTYSFGATPPSGMSINSTTGLIQWTANSSQTGNWTITVVVTDTAMLTATQSYNLSVIVNQTPTITSNPVTLVQLALLPLCAQTVSQRE